VHARNCIDSSTTGDALHFIAGDKRDSAYIESRVSPPSQLFGSVVLDPYCHGNSGEVVKSASEIESMLEGSSLRWVNTCEARAKALDLWIVDFMVKPMTQCQTPRLEEVSDVESVSKLLGDTSVRG
jgi:hypothetical protein